VDLSSIISLRFSDINGVLKEVLISEREFEKAVSRGIWFDGSSIEGFARRFESDMMLVVDTSACYTLNGIKTISVMFTGMAPHSKETRERS
jgi:glutamine synthetase